MTTPSRSPSARTHLSNSAHTRPLAGAALVTRLCTITPAPSLSSATTAPSRSPRLHTAQPHPSLLASSGLKGATDGVAARDSTLNDHTGICTAIGDIRAIETTHSTTPPVASGLFRPQGDHRRRRSTLHDSQYINHYTLLAQLTRSYAHRRCIVAARIIRDATADKSHRAGNNNYTLPTQLVQSSESTPWPLSQQGWGSF
jgi:hypothetical protein